MISSSCSSERSWPLPSLFRTNRLNKSYCCMSLAPSFTRTSLGMLRGIFFTSRILRSLILAWDIRLSSYYLTLSLSSSYYLNSRLSGSGLRREDGSFNLRRSESNLDPFSSSFLSSKSHKFKAFLWASISFYTCCLMSFNLSISC